MNEPNAGAPRNLNTTTQNTLFCHARMCKQLGVLGLHPVASGPSATAPRLKRISTTGVAAKGSEAQPN